MKTKQTIFGTIALMAATLLFAACGGGSDTQVQAPPSDDATSSSPAAASESAPAGAEAAAETNGPITITGNDQMRFSVTEFTVKAGSDVEIVFENVGQMPKEAMGHNLAILTSGTDPLSFATSSMRHANNEYIDPALEDQVIAATAILGPGESETLTFTAPSEPGEYPFICSFPGHTAAGMRGVMRVE